jgi:limonene-1,2-epoxide hydrolase
VKNTGWTLVLSAVLTISSLPLLADTNEEKLATAQKMVEAWNQRDWEGVFALFSPDAVMHSMMMEPVVGRDAIRERFNRFIPGLERIELQLSHLGIIDDVVVMERVDDFDYLGKNSRVPVAGFMEIDSGFVTEWREYYDHHSLVEALTTDEMVRARAEQTEQTIRQATEKLAVDWNGGGMEAYLAAYWNSENLSLMFGDKAIRGWEAVATLFRGTWTTEENMGDFSTNDVVVRQISPDTAISSGGFTHVFPTETVEGSFSHVWKQFEDGRWLIVHEHTSRKVTH